MFGLRFWGISALYAAGAALLLGIPTVLIPNHLFSRIVPTSPQDYVIWVVSVLLIGPLMGLTTLYPVGSKTTTQDRSLKGSGRALAGTLLSFFKLEMKGPLCTPLLPQVEEQPYRVVTILLIQE